MMRTVLIVGVCIVFLAALGFRFCRPVERSEADLYQERLNANFANNRMNVRQKFADDKNKLTPKTGVRFTIEGTNGENLRIRSGSLSLDALEKRISENIEEVYDAGFNRLIFDDSFGKTKEMQIRRSEDEKPSK
jgi:hypothetical protein